jgi:hypothetical protein
MTVNVNDDVGYFFQTKKAFDREIPFLQFCLT